ncbi:MAG: hypothetical protein WD060_06450 [Pirellulales bacterium]
MAVVAQAAPQAVCRICDKPCCANRASRGGPTSTQSGVAPAGRCPLCPSAADLRLAETNERPCRCQFNARNDQPLSPSMGILPAFADADSAALQAVVPPRVPQVLGVSREYVAASLAVPIRPPRILFGVWRN